MKSRAFWNVIRVALVLILGGCASTQKPPAIPSPPSSKAQQQMHQSTAQPGQAAASEPTTQAPPKLDETSRRELRRVLQRIPAKMKTGLIAPYRPRTTSSPKALGQKKQKVLFNFDKADITEVTNEIFGSFLKVGYVMDPALQGRISLYLEGEYTRQELIQLITRAYAASNVSVVPRDGIYFIQPVQRSTSSNLPIADTFTLKADKKGIRPVIVIYRPKYLDAAQAINTVRLFLTPGRPMISDPMTNSILFVDDTDNAKTILEVLRTLDMNVLQEIGMEVVQLKSLSPEEAVKSVEAVMSKLSVFQHSSLKNNVAFLPLEQLGGVLILAQNNQILRTAKHWLKALDVQGQQAGDQIEIYFIQNGLAKDIADILTQVFNIKGKTSNTRLKQEVVKNTQTAKPEVRIVSGHRLSASLSGEVTIIADENNNAIVVRANASDQEKIHTTIEALDIVPRAVLIEVLIAEVTLTDDLSYGVEWYIKNKGMDLFGYQGKYSASQDFGNKYEPDFDIGTAANKGLSLFWGTYDGDIAALVTLLSTKTKVHILSTPTLLAMDNQPATINVGGREPIITQQSQNVSSDNTILNTIQYVDTGIILNVTPHINSGGLIRNEIELTIRDAKKNAKSGIDSPSFTERKVKTTLLAKNGDTVLIGGIIQHKVESTRKGIPVLSTMPIIYPLFSNTSRTNTSTELIMAITQHVREKHPDAASEEFIRKLNRIRKTIQQSTGIQPGDTSLLEKPGS